MKIQVLHVWCKCAIVLKKGYISEMSLSIAFSKEKKKGFIAFCRRVKPWYTLGCSIGRGI